MDDLTKALRKIEEGYITQDADLYGPYLHLIQLSLVATLSSDGINNRRARIDWIHEQIVAMETKRTWANVEKVPAEPREAYDITD